MKKRTKILITTVLVLALAVVGVTGAALGASVANQKEAKIWSADEVSLTLDEGAALESVGTFREVNQLQAGAKPYVEADFAWDEAEGKFVCTAARGGMEEMNERWEFKEGSLAIREGLAGEIFVRYRCNVSTETNHAVTRDAVVGIDKDGKILDWYW